MITRDNYEAFIIDYIEGTLSKHLATAMEEFLSRNPDIKIEMEEFENVLIMPETIQMPDKWNLKKVPYFFEGNYFDHLCIAKLEGDISTSELKEFNTIVLENPEMGKEYMLYEKTIIPIENSIKFVNKNVLKHYTIGTGKQFVYSVLSIAAALMIFYSLFRYIATDETLVGQLAIQSKTIPQISITPKTELKQIINPANKVNSTLPLSKSDVFCTTNKVSANSLIAGTTIQQINNKTIILVNQSNTKIEMEYIKIQSNILDNNIVNSPKTDSINNQEYASIKEYVKEKFKAEVLNQLPTEKITVLSVLQAVVNGFNKLTGKSIKVDGKYNDQGKIQMLALEGDEFGIVLKK